jgi:hypothetical protein
MKKVVFCVNVRSVGWLQCQHLILLKSFDLKASITPEQGRYILPNARLVHMEQGEGIENVYPSVGKVRLFDG